MPGRWAPGVWLVTVAAVACLAAPASGARPVVPVEQTLGDSRILIHHMSGYTGKAQAALALMNDIFDRFTGATGMPLPISDGATEPTGDPRFDVYLTDENTGRANWAGTDVFVGDRRPAHIAIHPTWWRDDDFSGGIGAFAHEFGHASQLGLDGGEGTPWWVEQTANWMADRLWWEPERRWPGGRGGDGYLLELYGADPGRCADALPLFKPDDPHWQGGWYFQFSHFLADRFGGDVIAEVWHEIARLGAGNDDSHAVQALRNVLAGHGTTLEQVFVEWASASPLLRFWPYELWFPNNSLKGRPCIPSKPARTSLEVVPWRFRDVAFRVRGCKSYARHPRLRRVLVRVTGPSLGDVRVNTLHVGDTDAVAVSPSASGRTATFIVRLDPRLRGFSVSMPNPGNPASRSYTVEIVPRSG